VKKLLLLPVFVALASFFFFPANAEEKTVSASITPLVISLSLTPDSITYGTKQAGIGEVVSVPESVTVKNTGSVAQDFKIRGGNSLSSQWTLAATAGQNQFVHLFSTSTSNFQTMTTSPQTLFSNVAPNGDFSLYTRLVMPTTITETAVQTLPIYVLAVQRP
jgi:hypothetical protein